MDGKKDYLPPSILGRKIMKSEHRQEKRGFMEKEVRESRYQVSTHLQITQVQGDQDPGPFRESTREFNEVPFSRNSRALLPSGIFKPPTPEKKPQNVSIFQLTKYPRFK